jgi:opacity protein-like surface antigen
MLRSIVIIIAVLAPFLSGNVAAAQTVNTIVVFVASGDSLTGCSQDAFFSWIGKTSTGQCQYPQDQAASLYVSDTVANVSGVRVIGVNMGIGGARLNSGGQTDFANLAPVWIDPIVGYKTVSGFGIKELLQFLTEFT